MGTLRIWKGGKKSGGENWEKRGGVNRGTKKHPPCYGVRDPWFVIGEIIESQPSHKQAQRGEREEG